MASESTTSSVLAGPPLERIAKPWGEELILDRSVDTVVKMLRIEPGSRLSLQFHRHKHETLMLLSGTAILTLGPSTDRLRDTLLAPGNRVAIEPPTIHRVEAGSHGADILEVASRLQGDDDDIVRLAADYG
ncbi:MAG: hypothetical protein OXG42_06225, partial [Chloroflexi bacterium]|nr:hypothetical protein [Chloroflexota bacterium]